MDGGVIVVFGYMDDNVLMLVMGVVMVCRRGWQRMVVSGFMEGDVAMLLMGAVGACWRQR
jgi:hypothetical protein